MAENSTELQEKKAKTSAMRPSDPENTEPHHRLNGKQKAALVVVSLGAERASQIYKYLGERDIEELTFEVAKMGKTTNSMVETTLEQFYRLCLTHKMMTDGGMDYARAVLEKAFGGTAAKSLLDRVSHTLASKPFNFFSKGDPKALLSLLQNERPQVIALILSYMDAEQAAQILENLAEAKRIPTVVAMAKMDRVSPEAISIVEEEMKRKFDTIITSEDNMNLGGVDFVADVMNHIDRSNEKKIFDELDVTDPDLSADIKDKMFVFRTAFYQGLRFQGYCICTEDGERGDEADLLQQHVQAYGGDCTFRHGGFQKYSFEGCRGSTATYCKPYSYA